MSDVSNDDWLDIEPKPSARDLIKQDPQFSELVEHTKTLTAQQRNFLVCYSASHYDPVLACKKYLEVFKRKLSQRQLAAWLRDDPNFGKAIQMREEMAAKAAGVSAANVLDCLADIRRRNMGTDDRAAMQALEMIGKHLRMFRAADEAPSARQLPAFIVGVQIQQAAPVGAVNVQVTEVPHDN
ncbi:MAG TPA: hypothetical protein VGJ21_10280 [Terracidiphilus sp.]|jgi:hypothetical protein